jgi:hypothetical protein
MEKSDLVEFFITREALVDYDINSIGCEIAIRELSTEDITSIVDLMERNEYFDSIYFSEWFESNSVYHKTGLLVMNSLDNIFNEIEIGEDSSDNWEINKKHIEAGLGLSKIQLPNNCNYLISIRNQEFFAYGKIEMPKIKTNYKLDLYYDTFEPLHKFNGKKFSEMAIIHSVKINEQNIDFDFDKIYENGGLNFEINQFIVYNGNIIAWFNGDPGNDNESPKFQWEIGVNEKLPYISNYLFNQEKSLYEKNKSSIISELKKNI